ncbi:flagellar biosynthetic protein FliR [Comamonas flocculans]|uniref:Flagellar biosynthetic protein FliR n=1 Tax=Comamonas flocculans TaxID=2597701 RepID=A0A5B8RSC3_9BURK|nr:flagellar biosynthetic protein FliR [Comamonas flocculans]QEA12559.1 flagellar biosynthetic protein FliR [Comamonas flocculans]
MLTFDEAQLMAWVSPILWPFLRVLAMFTAAPIFSTRAIPVRLKVALAFLVAVCAQAALPPQPVIALDTAAAWSAVAQQVGVGLAIGFAVRLVFTCVELSAEVIGLQMGLNYASFFDPASNSQRGALTGFYSNVALWLFIVVNGHLMVLMALLQSFKSFPLDGNVLQSLAQMRLHELGAGLFSSALWLALPLIALLLFVNLTMGVISRVAPQTNIYAVGFPVTITVGLLGITATLPMLEQPLYTLLQQTMDLFGPG